MRLRRALLGEVAGPVVGVDEGHGTETSRAWCLGTTALERLLDLMQKQAEHPPGQRLVSAEMRRLLAESDMFHVIDLAPATEQIEAAGYIHGCNGLALVGTVHKVSSPVLSVSVVITDTRTEKVVRVHTANYRGNTDASWLRGVRYLVRNYLVEE